MKRTQLNFLSLILLTCLPAVTTFAALKVEEIKRDNPVDFQDEILPILRNNCLPCHNRTRAKADIVLETPQDILTGNDDGPLAVPGKPEESYLFLVSAHLEEPEMPPVKNKVSAKPLTPKELGLMKLWIQQGVKGEVRKAKPIEWHPIATAVNNPIYAVALSPDGQFAAAGRSNRIDLYHVPTGKHLGEATDDKLPNGQIYEKKPAHLDFVTSLAFAPDSHSLASGSYREIKFWKLDGPRVLKEFKIPASAPIAISSDGQLLGCAHENKVQIWDLSQAKKLRDIEAQTAKVTALSFSADCTKILSGDENGSLRAWSVDDGKLVAQAAIAEKAIQSVAYLSKGNRLVSGHVDNTIRTWEARSSEDVKKIQDARDAAQKALEAIEKEIEEAKKAENPEPIVERLTKEKLEPSKHKLADAQTALDQSGNYKMSRELKAHTKAVHHLIALPSNDNHLLSGSEDGQAILWDTSNGSAVRKFNLGRPITGIAVRPDGKQFAATGGTAYRIWADNGQQVAEPKGDRYANEAALGAEAEAKFAVSELQYREGELKKRTDEQKKAEERLKKAGEAKKKADEQPVAEKKTALEKLETERDSVERQLEVTNKAVEDAQKKYDAQEKARQDADSAFKDAESKLRQPTSIETQTKQALAQQKAALDKLRSARDNISNSKLKPKQDQLDKLTGELDAAAKHENAAKKALTDAGEDEAKIKAANDLLNQAKAKVISLTEQKKKAQNEFGTIQQELQRHEKSLNTSTTAFKEAEEKANVAKAAADKARTLRDMKKKKLDDVGKLTADAKSALDKLKKEQQEPSKKKLADLQKKIDSDRKEFDKINGPLQTAIRELENANLDLERAKSELDKATKLKANAEQLKNKLEIERDEAKKFAAEAEKEILAVSFAPDGTTIATSGADQKVHTWGTSKGEAHDVFDPTSQPINRLYYRPDGSLVTLAADGKVRLWDLRPKWKMARSFGSAVGDSPIIDRVTALDYSPDGKTLASGGGDPSRSGEVLLWNLAEGKLHLDLAGIHSDSVLDIDFSPDGANIATAAADKFVKVTDAIKGSVVRTFEGHTHHVMGVSWRRTGREILSSGADKDLKYWNFENGDRLGKGGGFRKEVTTVHFIGAGTEAIATSAEGKISVVRSGSNISQANSFPNVTKYVHAADVTPDGKLLAAGGQDGTLRIWTIPDRKLVHEFKPPKTGTTAVAEAR